MALGISRYQNLPWAAVVRKITSVKVTNRRGDVKDQPNFVGPRTTINENVKFQEISGKIP